MSSDVVIGYHGKPRCAWAGAGDTAFGRYHDEVWGTRTYDESATFEALTLGVFEAGLSWSIVFGKRDGFRTAFQGFDVAKVAAMTELDVDRLVQEVNDHLHGCFRAVDYRTTALVQGNSSSDR
jgi:DNA-3-methyladenine glycosylase I